MTVPPDDQNPPGASAGAASTAAAQARAAGEHENCLPVGTRMGEFEITGLIGEGGFGIVYAARDHQLERSVAVKEYMPSSLASRSNGAMVAVRSERHAETFETGLRSFVNEAKLLARFDHPSLVKVFRFWEGNGTAYMAMPLYQGPTLRGALKDLGGPPSEAWLMQLLRPLLEALEIIHDEHIFHRDIAPDNILILASGRPVLLDFGAARRVIGDMTQALTVILKPGYAPLEQYANGPEMRQGPWTDVYALGAVVYYCITGKAPPPSVSRLMRDTMVPAREAGAGLYSERFLAAIDHALAVTIEDRTASIAQLRDELGIETAPAQQLGPAQAVGAAQATGAAATGASSPANGSAAAAGSARATGPALDQGAFAPTVRATPVDMSAHLPESEVTRRGDASERAPFTDGSRASGPAMAPPTAPSIVPAAPPAAPATPSPARVAQLPLAGTPPPRASAASRAAHVDDAAPHPGAAGSAATPVSAPPKRRRGAAIAAGAAIAIALVAGVVVWTTTRAPDEPAAPAPREAAASAAAGAPAATAPPPSTATPLAAPVPAPAPAPSATASPAAQPAPAQTLPSTPPAAFSSEVAIDAIHGARDTEWSVAVQTERPSVRINLDEIHFSVRSERAGYLYLLMLGTDSAHFYLLFPNSLDRDNRVRANTTVRLPRSGWSMVAGGPAGTNRLLAMVSSAPRDFGPAGLRKSVPFGEFDLRAAARAYEGGGGTALAGSPVGCKDISADCGRFGAARFEIKEVD